MNFYLVAALNACILLPATLAVFLFSKIEQRFHPFVFCLWIGCFNEALSFWLIMQGYYTRVNNNIYALAEAVLLIWFFKNTGVLRSPTRFYCLLASVLLVSGGENFVFGSIGMNSTYFRIATSTLIVALSIRSVGDMIFSSRNNILKNAGFLLCCCFIIYFSFRALVQSSLIYGLTRDNSFLTRIYNIMLFINLGVNLLYIPAVFWMVRKKKFALRRFPE